MPTKLSFLRFVLKALNKDDDVEVVAFPRELNAFCTVVKLWFCNVFIDVRVFFKLLNLSNKTEKQILRSIEMFASHTFDDKIVSNR